MSNIITKEQYMKLSECADKSFNLFMEYNTIVRNITDMYYETHDGSVLNDFPESPPYFTIHMVMSEYCEVMWNGDLQITTSTFTWDLERMKTMRKEVDWARENGCPFIPEVDYDENTLNKL